jgi:ABC-2 type transport system permease protein
MVLRLLFKDELNGFYKSNVMIILWITLPLLTVSSYLVLPGLDDQMSISDVTSSVISSIGGWIAAMMLAIHIIHERSHEVYGLFLIRPVKRSEIILSKYFAVLFCVASACLLALLVGFLLDSIALNKYSDLSLTATLRSFVIGLAIISIECAAGAFVGVLVSSVLVGIISIVLTHNIASLTIIVPMITSTTHVVWISLFTGIGFSVLFLFLAIQVFKRRQL